jgi:hypothetical protein
MVKIKKKIICAFKCAKNNKVKISEQKWTEGKFSEQIKFIIFNSNKWIVKSSELKMNRESLASKFE